MVPLSTYETTFARALAAEDRARKLEGILLGICRCAGICQAHSNEPVALDGLIMLIERETASLTPNEDSAFRALGRRAAA